MNQANLMSRSPLLDLGLETQGELYYQLIVEFIRIAAACGYSARAYDGKQPDFFLALTPVQKTQVLDELARVVATAHEVVASGELLTNHKLFFWRMLVRLKLRPLSNFMSDISESDIIEVHSLQFVQIFRSLNFLQVCSYSLDELLCRPFFELYRRDASATKAVADSYARIFQEEDLGLQIVPTGIHFIEEISSPQMRRALVENRQMSPLFDENGKVVAITTTIRCYASEARIDKDEFTLKRKAAPLRAGAAMDQPKY